MMWKWVSAAMFIALVTLGIYTFWPSIVPSFVVNTVENTALLNDPDRDAPTTAVESAENKITKFGTMLAFQGGQGFMGNKAMEEAVWKGWVSFRDSAYWDTFVQNIEQSFSRSAEMVKKTGFSSDRDVVGSFAWNVIEPVEGGGYDWTLPDATMTAAGEAGVNISAVLYPYGSWQTTKKIDLKKCSGIDFVFFDSHTGHPTDSVAYQTFLTSLVERYDGDGVGDMPGLASRVEAWEVENEVEGPCIDSTVADYLVFLKTTYGIIKLADPNALVVNAGALEIIGFSGRIQKTMDFWQSFFDLGGSKYVDVFNVHYNTERADLKSTPADFTSDVSFFRDLLDSHGASATPIWMTEFGLPTSAAYTEYVGIGDTLGVERYFLDLQGPDEGNIGPAALFRNPNEAREFLTTLQELGRE